MNAYMQCLWTTRHLSIFAQVTEGSNTDIAFLMKTPSPQIAEHLVDLHNYDLIQTRNARKLAEQSK